jgi:hypothetical protein
LTASLAEKGRRALHGFFFTGFSGESLVLLRVYVGVALFFFHVSQYYSLLEIDPFGTGFVYLERVWYVAALGIERDRPLVSWVVLALLMAANVTMTLGRRPRLSIAIVLLANIYLSGVRDSFTGDTHHRFLIPGHILFFLLLSECGRAPGRILEWQASWPIRAGQLYTASFYFWSLVAKLRMSGWGWFEGGGKLQEILLERSVMWGLTPGGEPTGNIVAFELAHRPGLLTALSCGVFLLEGAFPLVLFIRRARLRLLFLLGATAFHVVNFALLYVGFVFTPLFFVIFFDLVPVQARLREGWRRARRWRGRRSGRATRCRSG